MRRTPSHFGNWLALSVVPTLLWLAPVPAGAQSVNSNPSSFQDPDTSVHELAQFDRFLDNHREIAEQVRKNPSLLTNQEFVSTHPALQAYLRDHAAVHEEISENPSAFMRQEGRLERHEDLGTFDGGRAGDFDGRRGDFDAHRASDPDRRAAVAEFDRFLDNHPQIAEQVRRKPSLLTNEEYLNNHPDLKEQIQYHPAVRDEINEDSNGFMRSEARYEQRDEGGEVARRPAGDFDARRGGDPDRRAAVAEFDRYLDNHPEIAEQVRRDPALLTNQAYLNNHPDLKAQIQYHPAVRDEISENPNGFMQAEARYEQRDEGNEVVGRPSDDFDGRRVARASFDRFLDTHPEIAEQVRKNPSLLNNQGFVSTHPALQVYLRDHATVAQQITPNPNVFMQQEARYDLREGGMDRDALRRQSADFAEFLGHHSNIAHQLSDNPSLVKHREYLDSRPELKAYLTAHPDVQQSLMADPEGFVKSVQQADMHTAPPVKSPTTATPSASSPTLKPAPVPKF